MQQEFPAKPKIEAKAVVLERPPGMWRQGWQRFRRNKTGMLGLSLVVLVVLVAMIGPYLAPYDPNDQTAMLRFASKAPPSRLHLFGTDRNGYDVLSRVIYGAPTALAVGIGTMLVASIIGVLIGGFSGFVGGRTDELLMRLTEFFLVIPVFIVILAVVRIFGIVVVGTWLERVPYLNLMTVVLLLGLFGWPHIARMARAECPLPRHVSRQFGVFVQRTIRKRDTLPILFARLFRLDCYGRYQKSVAVGIRGYRPSSCTCGSGAFSRVVFCRPMQSEAFARHVSL